MTTMRIPSLLAALVLTGLSFAAVAQKSASQAIDEYRAMLADGNPAELFEAKGEDLWKQKRGPRNVSLEACDLGKGPGVVKGAFVELPRYFPDTGKMQDLETRIVSCMERLQGFNGAEIAKTPFGSGEMANVTALATWIASESRGLAFRVPQSHPMEREYYQVGKRLFFMRGGTHDFACASCHGEDGKRIRLQDLPNLTTKAGAQKAYTTWPAYRVSQGELRSFQWRLNDCFRQQRFPEVEYASDLVTALTLYLAKSANGGTYNAPAVKR